MVAGLATVTAQAAITSDHQSLRDRNVKQALQAANAGLEAAMYRTNLMQPGSLQCAYKNPATGALHVTALQADGWCAEQTEDLGNGTTYTMRISGAQLAARQRPGAVATHGRLDGHGQRRPAPGAAPERTPPPESRSSRGVTRP